MSRPSGRSITPRCAGSVASGQLITTRRRGAPRARGRLAPRERRRRRRAAARPRGAPPRGPQHRREKRQRVGGRHARATGGPRARVGIVSASRRAASTRGAGGSRTWLSARTSIGTGPRARPIGGRTSSGSPSPATSGRPPSASDARARPSSAEAVAAGLGHAQLPVHRSATRRPGRSARRSRPITSTGPGAGAAHDTGRSLTSAARPAGPRTSGTTASAADAPTRRPRGPPARDDAVALGGGRRARRRPRARRAAGQAASPGRRAAARPAKGAHRVTARTSSASVSGQCGAGEQETRAGVTAPAF